MASAVPKLLHLQRHSFSSGPLNNSFTGPSRASFHVISYSYFSSTRAKGSLPVRARSRNQQQGEEDNNDDNGLNSPQENDLEYLVKVLAGSVVGGALIKYCSIVFPDITRPNIVLALSMIFTPIIVATFLLIKQSRQNG